MKTDELELRTACAALAKRKCATYKNGQCLEADCLCIDRLFSKKYTIAEGGIDCDWFWDAILRGEPGLRNAVFRAMDELDEESLRDEQAAPTPTVRARRCTDCGQLYFPTANNQIRCPACGQAARRKRNAASHRRRYWRKD